MAKTAYQQKRQFLNKINKRIKTLVERAGVERSDIRSLINLADPKVTRQKRALRRQQKGGLENEQSEK